MEERPDTRADSLQRVRVARQVAVAAAHALEHVLGVGGGWLTAHLALALAEHLAALFAELLDFRAQAHGLLVEVVGVLAEGEEEPVEAAAEPFGEEHAVVEGSVEVEILPLCAAT